MLALAANRNHVLNHPCQKGAPSKAPATQSTAIVRSLGHGPSGEGRTQQLARLSASFSQRERERSMALKGVLLSTT